MGRMLISLLVVALLVVITYYRLRDRVFELAQATDNKWNNVSLVAVCLVIAATILWLTFTILDYFLTKQF